MATSYALLSTYPPTQCGLVTLAAAQHDGIYGGSDRQDVMWLLEALCVPTIVVLHTALDCYDTRPRTSS
jgi:hypothetical protein